MIKFIDLFCGTGGFRIAVEMICNQYNISSQCVFSSDIDIDSQKIYTANFGETPAGDITKINENDIPEHDILLAGFPCQPFSICGELKGFADTRGTLFFDIARIIQAKKPTAFILENVKQLQGHQQGKTLKIIIDNLQDLGYYIDYKIVNALNFGLPQKRERILIIGFKNQHHYENFKWPLIKIPMQPLSTILENSVSDFYYASKKIRQNRLQKVKPNQQYDQPTIWHENKSGNISVYPYSCALRAGASYNYLLVNGERRLTEREMLRLQGFPESYQIVGSYQTMRKLTGNAIAIPCVASVIDIMINLMVTINSKYFQYLQNYF